MNYVLGLLSPIHVIRAGDGFKTLDLWVRDLQAQIQHTSLVKLFCPVGSSVPEEWNGEGELPDHVEVVPIDGVPWSAVCLEIAKCDVVQVPGGETWGGARVARRFIRQARRIGVKSVVGITSNRAKTALLNSRSRSLVGKFQGYMRYASVRLAQIHLTASADGAFIVGEGLRHLVSRRCKNLHVGIASWVLASDLNKVKNLPGAVARAPTDKLCIAARLERMKGVHIGIEALNILSKRNSESRYELMILGDGAERGSLEKQVESCGLSARVRFGGTRSYPTAFFDELRKHGALLLTNLNDEQPRVIFDAISQGCIPICPDSPAYLSLGLPQELIYQHGNSESLARAIENIRNIGNNSTLWAEIIAASEHYTMESMHARRAAWISSNVLNQGI